MGVWDHRFMPECPDWFAAVLPTPPLLQEKEA
jgi:hypothetical protein